MGGVPFWTAVAILDATLHATAVEKRSDCAKPTLFREFYGTVQSLQLRHDPKVEDSITIANVADHARLARLAPTVICRSRASVSSWPSRHVALRQQVGQARVVQQLSYEAPTTTIAEAVISKRGSA